MSLKLDHVVLLVKDLTTAIADFEKLGFNVMIGGEHTGGATHNALIIFEDDNYIELIAFKREDNAHRWGHYTQTKGEGLIDYALVPDNMNEAVALIRERGLEVIGPNDGGRLRPDGQAVRWQNAAFTTPELPFLCGDVTPRSVRVPVAEQSNHPNQVKGIAQVNIAVNDLNEAIEKHRALLGTAPEQTGQAAVFTIGTAKIVLDQKEGETGIYALALRSDEPRTFDPSLTHKAQIT
jgi:catechol 2,3-dioxygenase-like lactoylglutathione lyase family enzyme